MHVVTATDGDVGGGVSDGRRGVDRVIIIIVVVVAVVAVVVGRHP